MLCVDLAGFLQLDTFTVANLFFGGILKHRCDMHVLKIGDLTYINLESLGILAIFELMALLVKVKWVALLQLWIVLICIVFPIGLFCLLQLSIVSENGLQMNFVLL